MRLGFICPRGEESALPFPHPEIFSQFVDLGTLDLSSKFFIPTTLDF